MPIGGVPIVVSEVGGGLSQPVAGADRPQMFLRSTISSVMSKPSDVTDDGGEGYSLPYWLALMTLFFLRDCRVECSAEPAFKTLNRFAGEWKLSKVYLKALVPPSTKRRHNRA